MSEMRSCHACPRLRVAMRGQEEGMVRGREPCHACPRDGSGHGKAEEGG